MLEWIFSSRTISLNIPRLYAAMVDPARQLVFAISEPELLPTVLKSSMQRAESYYCLHRLKRLISIT